MRKDDITKTYQPNMNHLQNGRFAQSPHLPKKVCTTCGIGKDAQTEFYREARMRMDGTIGIRAKCRSCMKAEVKARREAGK